MKPQERIIVALDVPTSQEALQIMHDLRNHISWFKIGFELIAAQEAIDITRYATTNNINIFWDNKFNDIPNTVGRATSRVAKDCVKMLNVHALSGIAAMKACVENAGDAMVLAVTILTSMKADDLLNLGLEFPRESLDALCKIDFEEKLQELICNLANAAKSAGVHGIICSPKDVAGLKKAGVDLKFVTPGIRPEWAAAGDQKRIMSPREALDIGSDYLVIGRPITAPPNGITRVGAAERIIKEIS